MVQHTAAAAATQGSGNDRQQHQQQQQHGDAQHEAATPPPPALREFATKAARHRFMIPADEVSALLAQAGCSMDTLLLSFLDEAAHDARPPISNYKVGAVGLAASGAVYFGANLEFPGNPLSQSVHAEQFLMANLVLHGEASLATLAISAAPCGHCRQFYSELACADEVRFVFGHRCHAEPEVYSLQELLPARFGPLDLLAADPPPALLLQPQQHSLAWSAAALQTLAARSASSSSPENAVFAEAAAAALKAAAESSYAPYTACPAAVALITRSGAVVAGAYLESAAHNPGVAPLQAAVVAGIIRGVLPSYDQVAEVVLVEVGGAPVSHAGITAAVAATWGGGAAVTVLHADRQS